MGKLDVTGAFIKAIFNLPMILFILFAILLIIIKSYLNSKKGKGKLAETVVTKKLELFLDKEKYTIYRDLIVPDKFGYTQIDILVVSVYGIFVIEVKNFSGKIYAYEHGNVWIQYLHGKKSEFQNPIKQNYRHIKALSEYLLVPISKFHSVVLFIGDATFKTAIPKGVLTSNCKTYIESFSEVIITTKELQQIKGALNKLEADKNKLLLEFKKQRQA